MPRRRYDAAFAIRYAILLITCCYLMIDYPPCYDAGYDAARAYMLLRAQLRRARSALLCALYEQSVARPLCATLRAATLPMLRRRTCYMAARRAYARYGYASAVFTLRVAMVMRYDAAARGATRDLPLSLCH